MGHVYTLVNQKGGVGKTTTAINLGAFLVQYGQRVLIVDIDPQANATSSLGIDKHSVKGGTYSALINGTPALELVLHNPRLKLAILPSSPSLAGAEVELVNELGRELRLQKVIPVQCEYLALEGLGELSRTIQRVRSALFLKLKVRGVILTMFDGRTRLSNDVVTEVQKHFNEQVFKTIIPRSVRLAEAPSYGLPISSYAPESNAAKSYEALACELLSGDGVEIIRRID
jgi:chromosome partitioning protein